MISRFAVAIFSAAIFLLTSAIPASAEEAKPQKKGAKASQSKKVVKKENAAKPKPKAEAAKKPAKAKPAPKPEKKESAEKESRAKQPVPAKAAKKEDTRDAATALKEPDAGGKREEKKSAKSQAEENYILFESKPTGAEVLVDGFYMGNTPVQLSIVDGKHSVKLVRPGFSKWEKRVVTYAGFRIFAALEETKK
jgi:outer membrane biosynthesis protein TonB